MSSILTTAQIRMLMLSPAGRLPFPAIPARLAFPTIEGPADAFAVPHAAERAAFSIPATNAPHWGAGTHWQGNVWVSARPRRLLWAGERCLAFLRPKTPIHRGAPCPTS